MLNGFGDAAEIERLRAGLAEQHGVRAAIRRADMSKPAEIRELIATTRGGLRRGRYPGQQCRHPARRADRRFPDERWDAIIAINLSAAFHAARRRCRR